jgi:glutaredoxin-related protein
MHKLERARTQVEFASVEIAESALNIKKIREAALQYQEQQSKEKVVEYGLNLDNVTHDRQS